MSRPNRRTSRIAAVARVFSLVASACMMLFYLAVMRVRARADELLQSAGASMLAYARAGHTDAPRSLLLNGVTLHMTSGSTADSIRDLLDTFHARCKRVNGGFGERLLDQRTKLTQLKLPERAVLDGVLRQDGENDGYLACLDLGQSSLEPRDFIARARAFLASGDLAEVGDLRFIWAHHEAHQTSYVALFSEGHVPLRTMFPSEGDAPGSDVPGIPRPNAARRVLSAWQAAEAPMLSAYRVQGSVEDLVRGYSAQLKAQGYLVRRAAKNPVGTQVLVLQRARAMTAAIMSEDDGGGSILVLTPLR